MQVMQAGGGCNESRNISVPEARASEFPPLAPMRSTRLFGGTGKLQVTHTGDEAVFLSWLI